MGKRILPWDWLEDTISAFHLGYQSKNDSISWLHPFLLDKMKNSESSNDRKIFEHRPRILKIISFFFRKLRFWENVDYLAYRHPCYKKWRHGQFWLISTCCTYVYIICLETSTRAMDILADKGYKKGHNILEKANFRLKWLETPKLEWFD